MIIKWGNSTREATPKMGEAVCTRSTASVSPTESELKSLDKSRCVPWGILCAGSYAVRCNGSEFLDFIVMLPCALWNIQDSNLEQTGYESATLTIELMFLDAPVR